MSGELLTVSPHLSVVLHHYLITDVHLENDHRPCRCCRRPWRGSLLLNTRPVTEQRKEEFAQLHAPSMTRRISAAPRIARRLRVSDEGSGCTARSSRAERAIKHCALCSEICWDLHNDVGGFNRGHRKHPRFELEFACRLG